LARSVPYLHGSDLQQGDVAALEQGQKIGGVPSNKTVQAPARPQGGPSGAPAGSTQQAPQMQVPDPVDFATQRFGGTMQQAPDLTNIPQAEVDWAGWTPLMERVANNPNSSGILKQAFIRNLRNLSQRPYVPDVRVVDLFDLDAGVEEMTKYV
jgi:hypothetical protein